MAYRYRCGECGFKTSWGTESQGAEQQIDHYAERHPTIVPGGRVEANNKNPRGGNGCLAFIAVAILLLLFTVMSHH
ncbi:hypothetical protein [Streptacidiphilus albus]|uniref:hypothetical protein n=1 Tax=Streptacidiphilus albus TaxID=105425 RepID=UPI00054BD1DB|nr:hypothetical protein [Streptacidiphilus albus]